MRKIPPGFSEDLSMNHKFVEKPGVYKEPWWDLKPEEKDLFTGELR